ncbi:MAG: molybdate ABC transporter substrate-binding protein [Sulfurimonas sp.]|nr:molybdate ABC transporter substrate-binding protein [Sulfurimonas sp.]
MKKKILLLTLGIIVSSIQAKDLKIAVPGGYKKPFLEVIKAYKKNSGVNIYGIFGNIKQISVQAKQTDIAIVIGDKNYLLKKSKLNFTQYKEIGKGKLVLGYPKSRKLKNFNQLKDANIKKIAMPQARKTIYGISGELFLKNTKLHNKIKNKLYIVATIPQIATYLITNEIDAGIMNLTAALTNQTKIGGYIMIPQKYYPKISIVAGVLPNCEQNQECRKFINFLHSKESKNIFKQYGL